MKNAMTMNVSKKIFTVHRKKYKPAVAITPNKNLHQSLKWILVLAQCFGQMPVTGIGEPDERFLRFTWKSWRCLYTILAVAGISFLMLTSVYTAISSGISILNFATIVFNLSTTTITILFLKLAMEWPQLMRKWGSVEIAMRSYGLPPRVHTRIVVTTTVMMSLAAIETTMAKVKSFISAARCNGSDLLEYFLKAHDVFSIISYSVWIALVLQIVNLIMTFAWNFNDVFIMIMSTSLAMRFQQITARLRVLKKCNIVNIDVWREAREDYNRLSQLTRRLDSSLSYIILTSFANNLFFILFQLFNSLRPMDRTLEKVYFFFSFGVLILRTICVCLYGAWIYDESRKPLAVLNSVSSEMYNIEIKRFIDQLKFDRVALTGRNFFCITRSLILNMAGAVVTYELVLIQFNGNLLKEEAMSNNFTEIIC